MATFTPIACAPYPCRRSPTGATTVPVERPPGITQRRDGAALAVGPSGTVRFATPRRADGRDHVVRRLRPHAPPRARRERRRQGGWAREGGRELGRGRGHDGGRGGDRLSPWDRPGGGRRARLRLHL